MRVSIIKGRGRGVVATQPYRTGQVVEVSPVIKVSRREVRGLLLHYVFDFGSKHYAIALGVGSLFNHSSRANLRSKADIKGETITFRARRMIGVGEELTVDYGYKPTNYDGQ